MDAAGRPIDYSGSAKDACSYIKAEGLDAYEYQATYGVKIWQGSASELKKNSEDEDVLVSMHAPYYINLSSNKDELLIGPYNGWSNLLRLQNGWEHTEQFSTLDFILLILLRRP